ncbi:hypothetical protein [Candidatus Frankia nodulisporulans]|uniref:hypothetical protein n=1 Tax=Candidatus Frankia nodulisporulans TaxID=2060052 RepID=UPI0013D8423C|nr:hypothetical protein [Candidatus Frankia nodulisporulans]
MKARVTASQKFGPLRLRRSRTGAVALILRLGPVSWTWPLHIPHRSTAGERRAAETRAAQRAAGRRLALAEAAVAGLIVGAIAGAAWPWLAFAGAVAILAGASWAHRRHTLPQPDADD